MVPYLGGQGGEEEADQGDAADGGGDHGEQAQEQLHHSSHPQIDLIQSLFLIFGRDFYGTLSNAKCVHPWN